MSKLILENDFYSFSCPHCLIEIMVHKNDLNCKIFRHAFYKDSFKQIDPHSSKEICDSLLKNNEVIGCAKPFELIPDLHGNLIAIICDYK